eukprot:4256739-Ditylum_brightwellii.AAC.1
MPNYQTGLDTPLQHSGKLYNMLTKSCDIEEEEDLHKENVPVQRFQTRLEICTKFYKTLGEDGSSLP